MFVVLERWRCSHGSRLLCLSALCPVVVSVNLRLLLRIVTPSNLDLEIVKHWFSLPNSFCSPEETYEWLCEEFNHFDHCTFSYHFVVHMVSCFIQMVLCLV